MTADTSNRTLVLSVVAVDLVGYSRKSVAEQMALKDNFNQVLLEAIHDIPVADRIILDTGDGVAIGFLGDPEDALYVALFMHDAINRADTDKPSDGIIATAGVIRIGINLGPVKLATGVGGHPHIIGDGINVAERIMAFAEPGQLTVSRPFFEVMSTLSEHYATLFQYTGVRTDNQVRAHDVYLVGKSVAAFEHAGRGVAQRAAQRSAPGAGQSAVPPIAPTAPTVPPVPSRPPAKVAEAHPAVPPELTERHTALIDFLEDRKKVATTATLLAVLAVVLAALLIQRKMAITSTTEMTTVAAAGTSPASADSGASVSSPPPAPLAAATVPPKVAPSNVTLKTSPPKPATTAVPSKPSPVSAAPAVVPVTPVATPAAALSAKVSERPLPSPVAAAVVPPAVRDKPKDARIEGVEPRGRADKPALREEIRAEPRKMPPRPTDERKLPNTAPVVPTYQSSVQPPQPEIVSPTPTPPPAPAPDTRVVIVSRSEPSYPVEGIRQGILKRVIVKARVTIDARGGVTDVVIVEGGPISAFGRETRLTLKQWKFNPGAAGRTLDIEISFKP